MDVYELVIDNLKNNTELSDTASFFIFGSTDALRKVILSQFTQPQFVEQLSMADVILIDVRLRESLSLDQIANLNDGVIVVLLDSGRSFFQNIIKHRYLQLSRRTDLYMYNMYKLQTLFREPIGKLSHVNKASQYPFLDFISRKIGSRLPNLSIYSPYSLFIYQKTINKYHDEYKTKNGPLSKATRLISRMLNLIRNSPIHHLYEKTLSELNKLPTGMNFYKLNSVSTVEIFNKQESLTQIAIVTGHLATGGVERVILNIIKSLPAEKCEITLYTTAWNANEWSILFEEYCKKIVHIPISLGHKWPQKFTTQYLVDSLNANKPDYILITNSESGYAALPKLTYSPLVFDLLHTYGTPNERDAFLRISQPYDKYINTRIVISNFLKDYLVKHYAIQSDRIKVIYNPLNKDSDTVDLQYGKEYLEISNSEQAITFLGRLQPDKSPERLLAIADNLRIELREHNAFIAIVGEGSLKDRLIQKAKDLGLYDDLVRFYPFTDQPKSLALASGYTILTSNLEGIPMSILESMSVGTPSIAPAVGGIPEIITHDIDGLTVDIESLTEEEIVIAISNLVTRALNTTNSERKIMSKQATMKIDNKFNDSEVEYQTLFNLGAKNGKMKT